MNQNIFNIICKKCGGKCCKNHYIFLIKKESNRLLKQGLKFKYKKEGPGFLMDSTNGCKFLNKKTGCKLNNRLKPFDCWLYPLAFIYKNKVLNFYLIKSCAYYKKIDQTRLNKTKVQMRRKLKKWAEREKITYSNIIENYSKKELLKI
ncbi:MAG: YkgJ family cysteine cluster protein [Candidatus Falkowbacteria bacterium]